MKSKLAGHDNLLPIRRRFIKDFTLNMIEYYKRKYPKDWPRFLAEIKQVKSSRRNQFAQMHEGKKESDMEFRFMVRIPADFESVINNMLTEDGGKPFLEDRDEMKWFRKEFPQFAVATKD